MALPLLALLAPLVGGAMSLVGGAMSITGGVVHAGSTIAGIAADAAGGVMGAAGGLAGGGQSGQVQAKSGKMYDRGSPQGKMIVTAAGARKDKEGSSKGIALAKVKSAIEIDPGMMDEGISSLLPTGKESQTTLLGQILDSIRGLYTPIESIAAAVTGPPLLPPPPLPEPTSPEALIDMAQQTKGGDKGPGIVKRTFSDLGTRLSNLSSSLASTGKFLLKGLLLGGALLLFKKYEKQITTMVASLFETLEGWYTGMKDPESIWNNMGTIVEDTILPWIEDIVGKVMGLFVSMWNSMAEKSWWLPKLPEDVDYTAPNVASTAASSGALEAHAKGVDEPLGTVTGTAGILNSELGFKNMGGDADQQAKTQQLVLQKLKDMYSWVVNSDGRIQWTNIGDGFTIGKGINSLLKTMPIADIMSSQPIINGKVSNREDLAKWSKTLSAVPAGVTDAKQFRANQQIMTQSKQMFLSTGLQPTKDYYLKKFEAAERENRVMLLDKVSDSGSGQSIVVASNDNKTISTHHGDFVFPKLDVNHSDSTASAYREFVLA